MRRRMFVAALVLGAALTGNAWAGGKREKVPAKEGTGILVSATLEGATIKWKIALDNEGEKVLDMASPIAVQYTEKNGQMLARRVGPPPKPGREGKGRLLTAQGAFVKGEAQGKRFAITLKVGEGEKAAEQTFMLPSQVTVSYQEGPPLTALSLEATRKAEKPEKPGGNKPGKEAAGVKAPENL